MTIFHGHEIPEDPNKQCPWCDQKPCQCDVNESHDPR